MNPPPNAGQAPKSYPRPTGRAPAGVPYLIEPCHGSRTLAPYDKGYVARCAQCGWLDRNPASSESECHGLIGPHWAEGASKLRDLRELRRTFPNRSERMRLMADRFFQMEALICAFLARIHPLARLPLWIAYTCVQTFLLLALFLLAGISQLPAIWAGRLDDLTSVWTGESGEM